MADQVMSPEEFDDAWYAKVASRDPAFAARLRDLQVERMMNPGVLAKIARSVTGNYAMPPARGILQAIVNGQPVPNPRAQPYAQMPLMTGVRN